MRVRGWLVDVLLVGALAALTATLAAGALLDLDLAVRDWVDAHRPTAAYVAARALNYAGQGSVLLALSGLAALWLARRLHRVWPLVPVAAAWLALMLLVGPIKVLTDRAAPHKPEGVPNREEFLSGGLSYPSGHVANAIVWYGVLVLLLTALGAALPPAARWGLRVGPPVVVALVNTYLGFHWLTDTVAGAFAGLLIDRALRRVDWAALPLDRLPGGRALAARGWVDATRGVGSGSSDGPARASLR